MSKSLSIIPISTLTLILLVLTVLTLLSWKLLRLYFYSLKIPSFSVINYIKFLYLLKNERINALKKIVPLYSPVVRIWIGFELFVCSLNPEDIETVLTKFLAKGGPYIIMEDYFNVNCLLISPVDTWKKHRKIINPSFRLTKLNELFPVFLKHAEKLVNTLEQISGNVVDLYSEAWSCTFDISCETLSDVEAELLKGRKEFVSGLIRAEDRSLERFFNPFFHIQFIYKNSGVRREIRELHLEALEFVQEIKNKRDNYAKTTDLCSFIECLQKAAESDESCRNIIEDETIFMLSAASETTAVTISNSVLILGMYPELQEKVFEEISSVLVNSEYKITLKDLSRFEYLDRVIKETLRLFPPIPLIFRKLEKDFVSADFYKIPRDSIFTILVSHLHRRSDLWPNPLKFDPDRFLPEEAQKRHRSAFIPFSSGPRNCIGFKYAELSMKIVLITVLRHFKFTTVDYKDIAEIECDFYIVDKPRKGHRVIFEKRIN